MKEDISKEFKFDVGWKKCDEISFEKKVYKIIIKLQAYFETDGITDEQIESYSEYLNSKKDIVSSAEQLVEEYDPDVYNRFIPTTLLIERNGDYALLCNDKNDLDGGIAICLKPVKKVVLQDDYL